MQVMPCSSCTRDADRLGDDRGRPEPADRAGDVEERLVEASGSTCGVTSRKIAITPARDLAVER